MLTLKYGLLGKTLKHSYSKIIHELFGAYSYDLISVEEGELEAILNNSEYGGFNVTIPYKQAVIKYCSKLSYGAEKIGSVNTVVRQSNGELYGYNTDYDGFFELLRANDIKLAKKKVAVLGSGGTSKTALAVCKDTDVSEIVCISRNGEYNYNNTNSWNDVQAIINTTPVGMYPQSGNSLINFDEFNNCRYVADVVYNPLKTKLVFDAEMHGIKAVNGLLMLVKQAQSAYELFTGQSLPNEVAYNVYKKLYADTCNIVLIGMPGSGKSTVGKKVAELLGKEYIDIDEEIVKGENKTIPQIFGESGESGFRKLEKRYTKHIGEMTGKVISTGGGVVLNDENKYSLCQNGIIFYIKRSIENLEMVGRPLSKNITVLKEMYRVRKELYNSFADVEVENNKSVNEAAEKIITEYNLILQNL